MQLDHYDDKAFDNDFEGDSDEGLLDSSEMMADELFGSTNDADFEMTTSLNSTHRIPEDRTRDILPLPLPMPGADGLPRHRDGSDHHPYPGMREVNEEDLAKKIAQTGKIPDDLKRIIENGLNPNGNGIDLNKINQILEKLGSKHRIHVRPTQNGVEIELRKEGNIVDRYEATSPAAREAGERMRQRQQGPGLPGENNPGRPGGIWTPPQIPPEHKPGDTPVPPRAEPIPNPEPERVHLGNDQGVIRPQPEPIRLDTGDRLLIGTESQTLQMEGGSTLVMKGGDWNLTSGGETVRILPQFTLELRTPHWDHLSNGGRVIFHDNRTEIQMPDGTAVSFDRQGLLSITRGETTQVLRQPSRASIRNWD